MVNYNGWSISSNEYDSNKRQSNDAVFSIGNGYFGIRGFFEEDTETKVGNGGIYVAGIVGKGEHLTFSNNSRELCNIFNVLRLNIKINDRKVTGTEDITDFSQTLDMKRAVYTRKYLWSNAVYFEFSRFADMKDVHRIGQRVIVKSKSDNTKIDISFLLDTDVANLNLISCEPLPVQPGRKHIQSREIGKYYIKTVLDDEDSTFLFAAQKVFGKLNGINLDSKEVQSDLVSGSRYSIELNRGDELVVEKIVAVYTNKYDDDPKEKIDNFLKSQIDYSTVFENSCNEWEKRWKSTDIQIETDNNDDTAVRYNLFELMCACPMHTDKLSIGARGLTGEMYEGCIFWDTEIFQLPFFVFTDPKSAERLLSFRYNTLAQAKEYAKKLRINFGAQYPWQASEKGVEETETSAGFFSVHIIADIAYAIKNYVNITNDYKFLLDKGAEIIIETARFWTQRCIFSEFDGYYHLMTVRGPNEYSPIVDDNAFTNYMVSENLTYAMETVEYLKKNYPECFEKLKTKLNFKEDETENWLKIAGNLYICYDEKRNLIAEYPTYFNRYPFDIKKYKPTAKRILESGTPYDYLYFYQITKQADTVLLMCLLPDMFTKEQKRAAYDYYEPKTVHDSSLSYAPHALLASRIGKTKEAYEYFKQCTYLDIEDVKLNTVSGLHFANFGGTWMSLVFGFCGISFDENIIYVDPKLPVEWKKITLKLLFKGNSVKLEISDNNVSVLSIPEKANIKVLMGTKDKKSQNKFLSRKKTPVSF